MLNVFCGNDTIKIRQTAHDFLSGFEKDPKAKNARAGGVKVESIDAENYVPGILADAAGATSLFGDETVYLIDTPSVKKDFYDDVVANLEALSESANNFVVIEGTLLAPEKKKFAKYAEKFEEIKGAAAERFNVFAMADALARKDKKTLWLLLQEAKAAGLSEEEIIGTLWWQLKSLRLAAATKSASEAGMKDFPYNKAKRSLAKFPEGDLERLSHSLLSVYHDGHLGKRDIDLALERWCLTLR